MTNQLKISPAQLGQLQALNALAYQSKAHWRYSAHQLELWREDLSISAEMIAAGAVYAATIDDGLVGMFSLVRLISDCALDHFFVSPEHMQQGIGKQMWRYAVQTAKAMGAQKILIDADPNAEPFYLACGAVRVGEIAAPIEGDGSRVRPQLELTI